MIVAFGPAARRLAIGIEDGGQVELDIGQMESFDGIDDARGRGFAIGDGHAHHDLCAGRGSCGLGLAFLVERRPFGMFAIDRGRCSDRRQRESTSRAACLAIRPHR